MYFHRLKVDDKFGDKAQCNKCSKVYACTGGSTKGLHDHLQSVHAIKLRATKRPADAEIADDTNNPIPIPLKKIAGPMLKFVTQNVENTLQAAIACMVACDEIPFRQFITSPDISKGLKAQGFFSFAEVKRNGKENGDGPWQQD